MRRDTPDPSLLGLAAAGLKHLPPDEGEFFVDALLSGDPSAAIERQEARGQATLCASELLPTELRHGTTREQLQALGFELGEQVDELFCRATLPLGWKMQPTDHSMWSEIVDAEGRKRAGVFYKAAFYDRKAHMSLVSRFEAFYRPVQGWEGPPPHLQFVGIVRDAGQEVFTTEPTTPQPEEREARMGWYEQEQEARREEARAWLREHYPNFADPLAYWDED